MDRNFENPIKDTGKRRGRPPGRKNNKTLAKEQEVKDMQTKATKSKVSKGWDAEVYQKLDELFNSELPTGETVVPSMGDASTDFGQAVRYLSKLVYRYYNDGDVALATVGEKESSVNVALSYLEYECNDSKVRQCAEKLGDYVIDTVGDVYEDSDLRYGIAEEIANEQMNELREVFQDSEEYNALWDSEDEYIDEEGAFEEWLDEYYGGETRPEDVEGYIIDERLSNMVYDIVQHSDFEAGYEQRLETLAQAVYQYANQEYEKLKNADKEFEDDLDYYEDGWYYADKSRKHRKSKKMKAKKSRIVKYDEDLYDTLMHTLGTDLLFENFMKALPDSEVQETLEYIARMYDIDNEDELDKSKSKTIKGHTGTFRPIAKAGHYTMWKSVEHGSKAYNIITQTKKHARTGELVEKIVAEDVDGFDDPKAKELGTKQE